MGQRIKNSRKAAGLSQVELARTLGIDQSTLSDIERDENTAFSGKVLIKMADTLKKSPRYIVYGDDSPSGDDMGPEEAELLMAFRTAREDQRAALLVMARAIGKPKKTADPLQ